MKDTLEKNISSEYVVARGSAILDTIPETIEEINNSDLFEGKRKSVAKLILTIRENPELAYNGKYSSKALETMKKIGTFDAVYSRYREVLKDEFGITKDNPSIEQSLDYVSKQLHIMKNPRGVNK